MLLTKDIQMEIPSKLHNKIQWKNTNEIQHKRSKIQDACMYACMYVHNIQLHKDPTHCIIRSNQLLTILNTTDSVHSHKKATQPQRHRLSLLFRTELTIEASLNNVSLNCLPTNSFPTGGSPCCKISCPEGRVVVLRVSS